MINKRIKRTWLIFSAICLFPIITTGQSAYIISDGTMKSGVKLINGGDKINSKFCQLEKNHTIIKYSPYEVKEFGFNNGRVYISKEIETTGKTQNVFLERLYKGKLNLYFYNSGEIKTYFLEDSVLFIEIPKRNKDGQNFNEQLSEKLIDCPIVSKQSKLVSYNKRSLTELVSRYQNCESKVFPNFRYGINFTYEFEKFIHVSETFNENLDLIDNKYDVSVSVGLFADMPIRASEFSLHPELHYSRHSFSYSKSIDNTTLDLISNISSIKIPLLIRYAYPGNKFRPYFNLGGLFSYKLKKELSFYETTISENIIQISDISENYTISRFYLGLSAGPGIEYEINLKHSIFFEIRYNKQFGLTGNQPLRISEYNFTVGINF